MTRHALVLCLVTLGPATVATAPTLVSRRAAPPDRTASGQAIPPDPQPFPEGFAKGAYRSGGRVRPPSPRKEAQPNYPPAAAAQGANGVIEVLTVIQADGTVGAARALTSIQNLAEMEAEAVATARRYVFAPGTRDGEPVPVVATVFVSFDLPGVPRNTALAMGGTADPPSSVPAPLADGAVRPGADVLRPLPIRKLYPARASQNRGNGKVARVEFLVRVGVDGRIAALQLLSGGTAADNAEAEAAIRQWTFEPAIRAGKPVPLVMTAFVEF